MSERENLIKAMRTVRRKNMLKSPKSLEDLSVLTVEYSKTATGDQLLINDLINDDDQDLDGRIIVFATRRNLELLSSSSIRFLGDTFKVC